MTGPDYAVVQQRLTQLSRSLIGIPLPSGRF
jgi:hypothetical protein